MAGVGAASSDLNESRWPSKTVVSQERSFSVMTAQILDAAPASLSGPATRLHCMPRPLLLSLIMIPGRSACSGAFERDFNSPPHSARSPLSELAVPRSTPNSVRCSATFGAVASSASSSLTGGAEASTSGIGLATTGLTGLPGSISLVAEGSGGAMNDLAATSGVAGVAAGVFAASSLPASALAASSLATSALAMSALAVSTLSASLLAGSVLAGSSLATSDLAASVLAAGSVFGGSLATDEMVAGVGSRAMAFVAGLSIAGAAVVAGG